MKPLLAAARKEGADSPAFLALADAMMPRLTRNEQERFKAALAEGAAKKRTAKQEEAEIVATANIASKAGSEAAAARKGR